MSNAFYAFGIMLAVILAAVSGVCLWVAWEASKRGDRNK